MLPLFVLVIQNPQALKQFAQTTYTVPPMFGCLTMGESNKNNCASMVATSEHKLTLRGKILKEGTIYYGDILVATVTYKNAGDKPMKIRSIGMAARTNNGKYRIDFDKKHPPTTIQPGQSITLTATSHKFNNPDPGGKWEAFTTLTDDHGQRVDDGNQITRFRLDTTCTALRRQELTANELTSLTNSCRGKTTGLCNQVCVVSGGENCAGPGPVSTSKDGQAGPVCNNATDLGKQEIENALESCNPFLPTMCGRDGDYCSNDARGSVGGCNSNYCSGDGGSPGRCAPRPEGDIIIDGRGTIGNPVPMPNVGPGGRAGNVTPPAPGTQRTVPAARTGTGGAGSGNPAPNTNGGNGTKAQVGGNTNPAPRTGAAQPAPRRTIAQPPARPVAPKLPAPAPRPLPAAPPPAARCDGPSGPGPCNRGALQPQAPRLPGPGLPGPGAR